VTAPEWRQVIALSIPGEPLPKGRPRAKAGQQPFTPAKTRAAEKHAASWFHASYEGWEPLTGRLSVRATFYRRTMRHVDVDNLLKLVTDALNGVAFVDDEQIEDISATRVYGCGDQARTELRISQLVEPQMKEQ
jgi:crossover junction endodeoxyribonuclease RusA